jgi:mRNA interferase RelE/StbE
MYDIEIARRAQKELTKLPRKVQEQILPAIQALASNPRPHGVKKLKGSEFYRIRVGDYRVVYDVQDQRIIILVVRIRHRRDAYNS